MALNTDTTPEELDRARAALARAKEMEARMAPSLVTVRLDRRTVVRGSRQFVDRLIAEQTITL